MIEYEFDDLVDIMADPLTNNFIAGMIDKERCEIVRFIRIPLDTGFAIMSRRKYVIIDLQTDPITEKQKEEWENHRIGSLWYSYACGIICNKCC